MTDAPDICPALLYKDAKAAVARLTEAFGLTTDALFEDEDGRVMHAELSYGNGTVMLGSKGIGGAFDRAMSDGGPVGVYVRVADVDAHHDRAVAAGAEIVMPPTDQDFGARQYMARDSEGNVWTFGTYTPGTAG